jgi:hypothetical protein
MRACLAGEGESVCCGEDGGATDSTGDITGEPDSCGIADEVGLGDSCENTAEANNAISIAVLIFAVMSSEFETSLVPKIVAEKNNQRFLDFASKTSGLDVIAPVHVRKKIVAPLAIAQKVFVKLIGDKLIM